MEKTRSIRGTAFLCLALLPIVPAPADGGYFSRGSIAISADQRVLLIRNGTSISMTLSTGYTGDGEDFCWIIPTPTPLAIEDVVEAGQNGENAFKALDQLTAPTFMNEPRPSSCFPAGTAVLTAHGPRTIETIDESARVWACDLTTGNWALARVIRRIPSRYEGDVVTLAAGEITIQVTGNHPFRVLRGDRLDERPWPQDVPEEEPSTGKHGRWVEARDLKVGDVLAERYDGGFVVSELASRQERLEVFNLEVEGYRNYAVSQRGILVHNKGKKEVEVDKAPPLMTVYGKVILEHYEVNILGAAAASPLLEWLRQNGYRVNLAAEEALDAYIGRGWAFVAVKLNPAQKRRYEGEFLPALTLRYRSERLIFPLQISSVSTVSTVKISLYVIAESAISSATHRTVPLVYERSLFASDDPEKYIEARIREAAGRDGRALVVTWRGEYRQSNDPSRIFDQLMETPFPKDSCQYLTRLEARMDQSGMTEDIELVTDPTAGTLRVSIARRPFDLAPRHVAGLAGVAAIAAGGDHTLALKRDGTVWAWGWNEYGQLGDGSVADRPVPVQIPGLSGVRTIAAGFSHSVALMGDGTAWAWGSNANGELGDGSTTNRPILVPVQAPMLSGAMAIAARSYSTIALLGDGTVRDARGHPWFPSLPGVTAIAANGQNTLALKRDGTVWAYGPSKDDGEPRDGSTTDRFVPVQVPGLTGVKAIATGYEHAVALKDDGAVWTWRENRIFQLDGRIVIDRSVPVQVPGLTGVTAIAAGGYHTVVLKSDGTVWTWGRNRIGQLGDGSTADRLAPVQVPGLSGVTAIAAGVEHTVALKGDGTVWASGYKPLR